MMNTAVVANGSDEAGRTTEVLLETCILYFRIRDTLVLKAKGFRNCPIFETNQVQALVKRRAIGGWGANADRT